MAAVFKKFPLLEIMKSNKSELRAQNGTLILMYLPCIFPMALVKLQFDLVLII